MRAEVVRRGAPVAIPFLIVAIAGDARAGTSAEALIDKADRILRGKSSAGIFSMEVKTKSFERSFEIVVWEDSRGEERTLVKILGPALWRGHGTLKLGHQLKLYNPRTNHVTVVSHSLLGDSWMGSHFTNDDLVKETRLARDYHCKLAKSWPGKNEAGQAVTFHRIALTPKPTAPVAWGKIEYEAWERGPLVIPTVARYFRKAAGSAPERTLTFSQVKVLGGREVPTKMVMQLRDKPGEYTSILYKQIKFDVDIPASKFTEQALRH